MDVHAGCPRGTYGRRSGSCAGARPGIRPIEALEPAPSTPSYLRRAELESRTAADLRSPMRVSVVDDRVIRNLSEGPSGHGCGGLRCSHVSHRARMCSPEVSPPIPFGDSRYGLVPL